MRVLHLTASSFFGGPERQMLGLAGALPSEYSTSFLSFSESGRCRTFLKESRRAGFDAAELGHDFPQVRLCVRELTAFLRGNFVDVLVTHGYKSNVLGRPAARVANVPIVSVSRGWTSENLKVWCYEALDRMHLRFMDRVVCVSSGQAGRVLRAGVPAERVRVIRNGARLSAFANVDPGGRERLQLLADGPEPIVLGAGRLSSEKGFRVLVDAAKHVRQAIPGARFVICGEGAERNLLEHEIRSAGLANVVRLVGFRHDLDSLIPFADAVAIPSFTEGLPNIALEAGAAGVPVVATAVGGTPEVVRDGVTGYLVPSGRPELLARALVDLLQNPERAKAFGAAARQRMRDCFTFEAQARAYRELFAEVTRSRRPIAEPACT